MTGSSSTIAQLISIDETRDDVDDDNDRSQVPASQQSNNTNQPLKEVSLSFANATKKENEHEMSSTVLTKTTNTTTSYSLLELLWTKCYILFVSSSSSSSSSSSLPAHTNTNTAAQENDRDDGLMQDCASIGQDKENQDSTMSPPHLDQHEHKKHVHFASNHTIIIPSTAYDWHNDIDKEKSRRWYSREEMTQFIHDRSNLMQRIIWLEELDSSWSTLYSRLYRRACKAAVTGATTALSTGQLQEYSRIFDIERLGMEHYATTADVDDNDDDDNNNNRYYYYDDNNNNSNDNYHHYDTFVVRRQAMYKRVRDIQQRTRTLHLCCSNKNKNNNQNNTLHSSTQEAFTAYQIRAACLAMSQPDRLFAQWTAQIAAAAADASER